MHRPDIMEPDQLNGDGPSLIDRGRTLQQVRTAFCTAVSVQKARNLAEVKNRLMQEARLMGGDCYYGWRAGTDHIEGPSIDLAVAAARCWGNCATDMMPVQELGDAWIFTAAFIDLETGYTRTRQFRQSKYSKVPGKLDEERKEDIRFQIGQSKAERNVILKALPSWLITAALDAAKEGVRDSLDALIKKRGLPAVQDAAIKALSKHGVKENAILARVAVAERKGLTLEHLILIRGDLHALQSGQERAEVLFPPVETAAPPPPGPQQPRPQPQQPRPQPQPQPHYQEPLEQVLPEGELPPISNATLQGLYQELDSFELSTPDRQELLRQYRVHNFDDLTEEEGQTLLHQFRDANAKRRDRSARPTESGMREPGDDTDQEQPDRGEPEEPLEPGDF